MNKGVSAIIQCNTSADFTFWAHVLESLVKEKSINEWLLLNPYLN